MRRRFLSALVFASLICGLSFAARAEMVVEGTALASEDFTLLSTAWDPGPNVARSASGNPAPGSATWSLMGAGFVDVSGFDPGHSGATAAITSLAVGAFTVADYKALIDATIDIWAAASAFTNLGEVADGAVDAGALESAGGHLGDIRVAAWAITTSGVLAHAFQPGTQAFFGPGGTIAGDVHIDTGWTWSDDPTDTTSDSDFDLFTVMLHEIGHALGMGHSTTVGSVMEPIYGGARRTLHADDIAGIQAIYGPPPVVDPVVPEPSSMILLGIGAFGMLGARGLRRRSKATAA